MSNPDCNFAPVKWSNPNLNPPAVVSCAATEAENHAGHGVLFDGVCHLHPGASRGGEKGIQPGCC